MVERAAGPSTRPGTTAATQTITEAGPSTPNFPIDIPSSGTLRLRAQPDAQTPAEGQRHIQWAEDVVDNEGMGKKSSKVCCIYHPPHAVGESSDEDSSDSSSSSDSDDSGADDGAARPARRSRARRKPHRHRHDEDGEGAGHDGGSGKGKARKASPNAYERAPKYKGQTKKEGDSAV